MSRRNNFVTQVRGLLQPDFGRNENVFRYEWERFHGLPNAAFGCFSRKYFIVSQGYDESAKAFELAFIRVNGEWREMNATESEMIHDFCAYNEVNFKKWRKPGKTVSFTERRERRKFAAMQANTDATFRYRKGNPVQRKLPQMNSDYQYQGQTRYGKHIEMNGKRVYMGKSIVQYMDGPGTGLRPLDTGCFIGTGRKVKFAKAPQ